MTPVRKFDVLLVYYLFRKHDYYAHIVKELSKKNKVGLLLSDEEDFYQSRRGHRKVRATDEMFRSLCYELGAEKVLVSEKVEANLVIFPVLPNFTDDFYQKFKSNILTQKIVGLFFFLSTIHGIERLQELGCHDFLAAARFILEMKLKDENSYEKLLNEKVIELGFPHKKYPLFSDEEIGIDYLVCFPSHTHFNTIGETGEKYRYIVVREMYKILKQIPKKDRVFIKYHNNRDNQYNFKVKFGQLSRLHWLIEFFIPAFNALADHSPFLKKTFFKLARNVICAWIEGKYQSLAKISKYHSLGAESFLPHVKKGLITGNSSTHLHALKNGLAVYNCDTRLTDDVSKDYHLTYLVPYTDAQLSFDIEHFKKLPEDFIKSDVIAYITQLIQH